MPNTTDAWRRWFGLLFLALAFGMLIWGRTVLNEELQGVSFLIYWSICFLFTFAAIFTALLDMRATRKAAREQQRDLLRRAMDDMDKDADQKKDEKQTHDDRR
jgi:hypothetical protein